MSRANKAHSTLTHAYTLVQNALATKSEEFEAQQAAMDSTQAELGRLRLLQSRIHSLTTS
jgi:hypothetical protein